MIGILLAAVLLGSLCGCSGSVQVTNLPVGTSQTQSEAGSQPESTQHQETTQSAASSDDRWEQMQAATLQYPSSNDDWKYNVYDCYVELTKYIGAEVEALIIPSEIDGLPVWSLNTGPIYSRYQKAGNYYNDILTSVKFPDCLLTIGDEVFLWCRELTSFVLPDTLISIGDSAFENCLHLSSLSLPDGLQTIGDSAFDGVRFDSSSIPMILVPASVEKIGYAAFRGINYVDSANHRNYGYEITILNENVQLGDACFESALVVHGYAGSTAAQYCADHSKAFKAIDME